MEFAAKPTKKKKKKEVLRQCLPENKEHLMKKCNVVTSFWHFLVPYGFEVPIF